MRSFFLRMFQTVVLATPNVFAISLMGLFCFFSLMMACFTDSDSSLDLILTVDKWEAHMQTVVFLHRSPDLDVNTLKLKLTVCS